MADLVSLAQMCAPAFEQTVSLAVMKQESGFNPFAIGINRKGARLERSPDNYAVAVATAKKLIQDGYSIDMGLAQINSANLKKLGMTVEEIYQPCNNLKAMQTILLNCYNGVDSRLTSFDKLSRAFSCYNTGGYQKGFTNGYVRKVTNHLSSFYKNRDLMAKTIPLPNNSQDLAVLANNTQFANTVAAPQVAQVQLVSTVEPTPSSVMQKPSEGLTDVFSSSKNDIFN